MTKEDRNSRSRFFAKAGTAATVVAALLVPTLPADAAGLLVATGGFGGVLEIREHNVLVTINDGIAVTQVEQIFVNTENRQVEALYTFPVPKGASVANFSMWINGKEMVGEVVEKERARKIYESYKRTRRDPGLLEQVDYKTFEMRIFPIGPQAEQRIRVTYYQELDVDHDWATYVYPLATVTRTDIRQRTTGKFGLTLETKSSVPIATMESPSHADAFVIAPHGESHYQASLETEGGDLSRDLVVSYRLKRPQTGIDVIASKQSGEDGYFLLTLTAGEELARLDDGMDYVFILDVSGSMANDAKLHISLEQLSAFVETLGENDRFETITFNVQARTLFNQLAPVSDDTRQKAVAFLDSQRARGGTVLQPALTAAYRYLDPDRTLNVVILSDGMTEQAERATLLRLIQGRPENTRIFCIGVGNEVNRPLLTQLAEDAGGLASFLSRGDDFKRQAKAFRRKLTHPAATNLRIDFQGLEVYDVEPRVLPNLYHGSPVRLYGRYRRDGEVTVAVQATVQGRPLNQEVSVRLPAKAGDHPEIERMWAWHKVQRLLKEADRAGSRNAVTEEIVRLGEAYSIATEYTSFIVLENDAEYKRWRVDRRNALRIERDRKSRQALQARLESMRLQAQASIGPAPETPQLASAQPTARTPVPNAPNQSTPRPGNSRSFNLDFGGDGGGAFDPLTGGIALALGGLAIGSWRRRRSHTADSGGSR